MFGVKWGYYVTLFIDKQKVLRCDYICNIELVLEKRVSGVYLHLIMMFLTHTNVQLN